MAPKKKATPATAPVPAPAAVAEDDASVLIIPAATPATAAPVTAVAPTAVTPAPVAAATPAVAPPPAEDPMALHYFGTSKSKVVGIQHYRGIVSRRERLILEREPNNPYDRNAIMVRNSNGDKVGHIPRDVASFLSRYIDKEWMDVEAVTGSAAPGVYTLAIVLHIFVTKECAAEEEFKRRATWMLNVEKDAAFVEAGGSVGAGGSQMTREAFASEYDDVFTRLTAGSEGDPFAGLDIDGDAALSPSEAFVGTLLPYQRQGVAWMRHREAARDVDFSHVIAGEGTLTRRKSSVKVATEAVSSKGEEEGGAAPKRSRSGVSVKAKAKADALAEIARKEREATSWFWKECGGGEYTNVLTNYTTKVKPQMPRGGLLGDAMGLGKTVQMLAIMSHKIESAPTLIVCPLSLLSHWEDHVKQFLPSFTVAVYHGAGRGADTIKGADIVVTTYATIGVEGSVVKASAPLQGVKWGRVVLDEAHTIKTAKTSAAKACTALTATARWCVTGTPLQNSLADLQSLIGFLHIEPFAEAKWWQSLLIRPMRARDPRGLERLRCLLRAVVLRRTKASKGPDGTAILSLPPITVEDRVVPMSSEERVLYDRLKDATKTRIEKLGASSSSSASSSGTTAYAEALVLLLRLRQLCNHPSLIPSHILAALKADGADGPDGLLRRMGSASEEVLAALEELLSVASDETCSICLEPVSNAVVTECRHLFCYPCVSAYAKTVAERSGGKAPDVACPNCRGKFAIAMKYDDERVLSRTASQVATAVDAAAPLSSKVAAVTQFVLEELRRPLPPTDAEPSRPRKVVVFSQWPSMLTVLSDHISAQPLNLPTGDGDAKGTIGCVSLTGSMSAAQRQAAVAAFGSDDSVRVMFLSTMAGSVGLNLVAASACVLVDPWWNPSIDQQAIMRVHRIGQKRSVTVARMAMEGSVELAIWELQRKKQALFDGAFGGGPDSGEGAAASSSKKAGLSFDELRQFFK